METKDPIPEKMEATKEVPSETLDPNDPISKSESSDTISVCSEKIVHNAASIDVIVPVKEEQSAERKHSLSIHDDTEGNFLVKFYRRKTKGLSATQIAILCIFPFVEFFAATVISIQGPFYPQVARSKGATPSEYGFVFGSFELTVFICAPIMGVKMGHLKPHRLFNYGIFTTSLCCIIFGFLHHFEGRYTFIILSVVVRIIEAIGDAAFVTASFSIIASKFPDSLATTFALMETFYGFGMIAGPTIGGALYQLGGFTLPFAVMGALLFLSAIATYFFITKRYSDKETDILCNSSFHMFKMLRIPVIALTAFGTFAAATGIGFLSNNLQRHLEQFGVNEFQVGSIFMLNGGVYALTAPFWGKLCEKSSQPKMFSLIGSVLTVLGFILIGPLPFFSSWNPTILIICIGLVIFGLGLGATLVSAFLLFMQDLIANGNPDDVNTHGLVSGLWTSMTALGFFVGPTIGGILDHHVGFRWGTLFILAEQLILIGLLTHFFLQLYKRSSSPIENEEKSAPEADGDDLNDIVVTYAVKTNTPKPKSIKQRSKELALAKNANDRGTDMSSDPLTTSKSQGESVSDKAGSKKGNGDEIGGVENPQFVSD